ncbi:hypothetical protein PMI09_02792 [Rhizobium sp. CF122]|uniref:zinc finger-like domain-containing protein n=1 Tax=Rhizobium sp. CF122 TaxID=1144312 RepID=UPI000271CAE9|nr:zinc finger-like domain-containing protein [Rhizobium sp. CF122]EJL53927.1 hypothetical protein PMI09_02792 [Rhizobium sp. CF122]
MSDELTVGGLHPDARVGEAFENRQGCCWPSLVRCIQVLAPAEAGDEKLWLSDDDDVRDAEQCLTLADRLDGLLEDGSVADYVAGRNAYFSERPRPECSTCDGTGVRRRRQMDEPSEEPGVLTREQREIPHSAEQVCFTCNGLGTVEHQRYRDLYVSDIREFSEFLRHAGGFYVWVFESAVNSERFREKWG